MRKYPSHGYVALRFEGLADVIAVEASWYLEVSVMNTKDPREKTSLEWWVGSDMRCE
jgi:hypothetical protein